MTDNQCKVLTFTEEFTQKHGYTPTTFQIANELFLPHDKVSSIVEALTAEGVIKIHRPLT